MSCCEPTIIYVYVILVDGNISKEGFFPEEDLEEAKRVAKKYEMNYTVKIKRLKQYQRDLT